MLIKSFPADITGIAAADLVTDFFSMLLAGTPPTSATGRRRKARDEDEL